ncbi:hypothetical protein SADUNF_Sadunf16G0281300 [Salix dunnii]|uniref:Phytocyanin domain-containing protein n=1 Tax=Salix dunnii TaxID=1413687 RepID=A0A835JEL5_9ROSI|nr:hypothetical protein SADUNF_Sadunf16G0281300 [Salix dunnii]
MAYISYQNKVFHVLGLLSFLLMIEKSSAFQFPVGGDLKGWTVPDNTSSKNHYNDWANITRFQIGDSLLFSYDSSKDSVLQVSKEDYDNCTTTNPIATFHDAKTVITFKHSGPYYFISGNKDNCLKNEKLVVVVLADRSSKHSTANTNQTTTASPPSPGYSDMVPAPTPSSDETPPAGIVDTNPAQAPADVPPNSASSMFVSFAGSTGAIFASSLVLSF